MSLQTFPVGVNGGAQIYSSQTVPVQRPLHRWTYMATRHDPV